jgi:hypothetical protein
MQHEETITRRHDRSAFDCGDTELNEFLMRYARQSHDQGAAKTFTVVGGTVLIIDAGNDRAAAWYVGYGAIPLVDAERTLVIPLATIENLLKEVGKLSP